MGPLTTSSVSSPINWFKEKKNAGPKIPASKKTGEEGGRQQCSVRGGVTVQKVQNSGKQCAMVFGQRRPLFSLGPYTLGGRGGKGSQATIQIATLRGGPA